MQYDFNISDIIIRNIVYLKNIRKSPELFNFQWDIFFEKRTIINCYETIINSNG